jgi:hypothetical protein
MHPCLIPDLREKDFRISLLPLMLIVALPEVAFVMLMCVLSMVNFFQHFYWKRILNFIQFFATIEMIIWHLSFVIIMWCIMIIDLCMLNHFCIPRMNST